MQPIVTKPRSRFWWANLPGHPQPRNTHIVVGGNNSAEAHVRRAEAMVARARMMVEDAQQELALAQRSHDAAIAALEQVALEHVHRRNRPSTTDQES